MINQFINLKLDENLHYYFLPAYDGINITNFSFNVNIGMGYGTGRKFQKAEIAIIMSQIAAIKFAQMMNFDNVIILEDDIVLCEDWHKRLDSLIKLLPENWEHVYLSGHSDYVNFDKYNTFTPSIISAPKMVGAFSYMINKSAYSKITRFTSSLLTTFDDMIMHMIDQQKLNSYVYFPFMTFHNANESTVWDGKDPGHLTNSGNVHSSFKYFKNKI
jgi:GR25 family glycosyltransferase involved in LPS biosynthesis